MADAAAPYAAWMNTTAAQAEQTAAQAQAAASAYESAYSMTMPPAQIAANRAQLASLIANNVLGQNTPATRPPRPSTGKCGLRTPRRCTATPAPQRQPRSDTVTSQPKPQCGRTGRASRRDSASHRHLGEHRHQRVGEQRVVVVAGQDHRSGSNTSTTGLAGLLNALDGANGGLLGSFLNNARSPTSATHSPPAAINPTAFLDTVSCFSYLFPGMAGGEIASDVSGLAAGLGSGMRARFSGARLGLGGLGAAVSAGVGEAAPLGVLSVPEAGPRPHRHSAGLLRSCRVPAP